MSNRIGWTGYPVGGSERYYEYCLDKYDATVAPATTNNASEGYSVGSRWFDVVAVRAYLLVAFSGTSATWIEISPSLAGYVPTSRTISTTPPLTGGGDLSANRTIALADGDRGDITVSGSGATWTIDNNAVTTAKIADNNVTTGKVANNAITYAKMQDISAASRLIGRGSADGAGDPQEIILGTNLAMSGTTLNATGGTGTVTSVDMSGGTTGMLFDDLPITTSGTGTLKGTLVVASGGTGATNAGTALSNLGGQPVDADLTALAALTGTGIVCRTGAATYAERDVTSAHFDITNPGGVGGNININSPFAEVHTKLAADHTYTAADAWQQPASFSVSLSVGTWHVMLVACQQDGTNGGYNCRARLYNVTAGAIVANSEVQCVLYSGGTAKIGTGTIIAKVVVASGTSTIRAEGFAQTVAAPTVGTVIFRSDFSRIYAWKVLK